MGGKPAKRKTRRPSKGLNFFLAAALLAVLAFIGGYLLFAGHERTSKTGGKTLRPALKTTVKEAPPGKPAAPLPAPLPRVAIIIDDMGQDMGALEKIKEIGGPLDVAILPMLRRSKETAVLAEKAGLEVLLHLPMQPKGDSLKGLGPGALLSGMDKKQVQDTIQMGLDTVPGAVGVNNHMGSALTEERETMRAVMGVLKGRGMFFVDSRTTSKSEAVLAAKDAGVRAASRRVFLDGSSDPRDIKEQFDRLVALAKRDGYAIAIGHPHPNTLAVLKQEVPGLKKKGVELVHVGKLVK